MEARLDENKRSENETALGYARAADMLHFKMMQK